MRINLKGRKSKVKYYLGIESSTTNCSVSLFNENELLASLETNSGYSHLEKLAVHTKTIIEEVGVTVDELSGIGIGVGPGSYTGLRIGVSFVKGLALSSDIPIVSFTSLELMMRQVSLMNLKFEEEHIYIPMIDARRMEVYCQVFDSNYNSMSKVYAEVLNGDSFKPFVHDKSQLVFFGPGSEKFLEVINTINNLHIPEIYPSSKVMLSLIESKLGNGEAVDLAYFEPFYLKNFVSGKPKKVILSPE